MHDSSTAADLRSDAAADRLTALQQQARQAAIGLAQRTTRQRSDALKAMGDAILAERDRILEANTLDLEISREMAVPEQVTDWLKLTPERINRAAHILHRLGDLGSPFDIWVERRRPLGVVALVYESFPELGALAAGLCLSTCNSLVLKGSNESSQTNQALVDVLLAALATTDLPRYVLQLVPPNWSEVTRGSLLQQSGLNLVIPHGRPKLIEQVAAQAAAPLILTYIGGCSLCVRPSANLETVVAVVLDSHRGEPDAVNRIRSLVLAGAFESDWLEQLWQALAKSLTLKGPEQLSQQFGQLSVVADDESHANICDRAVVVQPVATLAAAIDWLNARGGQRVMGLCTALQQEAKQFTAGANGVELYINTSPRFYRNPATAADIALGMSAEAGRVGLEALTRRQPVRYG